jgi:phosphate transport system substrate-binding protein
MPAQRMFQHMPRLMALVIFLWACSDRAATTEDILIRGSDSEVNLVQRIAEEFMKEHPGVHIAVTGGGSGTGIAALIEGTIDIANSSRSLEAHERLFAFRNDRDPVPTLFATDALSVIVHPKNPIRSLTVEQIGAMFRGDVTDWSAFGGKGEVVPYGRQSSSGTYSFFRDQVLQSDFGNHVREMNGNAQIVEAVANDPNAVGYVAVGYLESARGRVNWLRVSPGPGKDAIDPTDFDRVMDGHYPIARPLYQFTDGQPTGATLDFFRYELSDEGALLSQEMGFYPVARIWQHRNAHLAHNNVL